MACNPECSRSNMIRAHPLIYTGHQVSTGRRNPTQTAMKWQFGEHLAGHGELRQKTSSRLMYYWCTFIHAISSCASISVYCVVMNNQYHPNTFYIALMNIPHRWRSQNNRLSPVSIRYVPEWVENDCSVLNAKELNILNLPRTIFEKSELFPCMPLYHDDCNYLYPQNTLSHQNWYVLQLDSNKHNNIKYCIQ